MLSLGHHMLRYLLVGLLFAVLPDAIVHRTLGNESVQVTGLGSPTGLKLFAPGRWGLVRVTVLNDSAEAATVRATVNLKATPDLRFGRDVWIPAGARRTTTIPVHLPQHPVDSNLFEIVGRVVSGAETSASLGRSSLAQIAAPDATAYIDDSFFETEERALTTQDAPYEAVLAMRAERGLTRTVASPSERLLPTTIQGWDAVRHLVVAGKRLASETGAAAALRQWVSEGGRMWIQLNRADVPTVTALFGSTIQIAEVDRVALTTFEIKDAHSDATQRIAERDESIELIRAHIDGGNVLFEIDGWPAAVEFEYGRGQVLLTLLDAHGWMRPRTPSDPSSADPLLNSDFIALDPLADLAARMYEPRDEETLDREVIARYVSDRIGYEIPGRATVLTILTLFCTAILLVGVVLATRQRLEHLAWLAATAAIVATLLLVMIGRSHRGDVPPAIAEFQLMNLSPQTGEYSAHGAVAVFQPEQVGADFRGLDGRIDPQLPELSGQIRELIWTDGDRWQWDGTRLPPGVLLMWSDSAGTVAAPVRAHAWLGPEGLQGHFSSAGLVSQTDADSVAEPVQVEDAMILFPNSPALAANIQPDGDFLSGEQDRLVPGQLTNEAFVDDEQRRRQHLATHWLEQQQTQGTLKHPLLVAWLNRTQSGLHSAQASERIGATLVTTPLELTRPPAHTKVAIPSPLIRARSVRSVYGQSAAFDNQWERWNFPIARSSITRLRFQIPDSVLPLRLDTAHLSLDCNIPSRVLEVFVVQGEDRLRVGSYANPSGEVRVTLTDQPWLDLDAEGGLLFDIAVGDSQINAEKPTIAQSGWSIRSSRLEVMGTTLPLAAETNE